MQNLSFSIVSSMFFLGLALYLIFFRRSMLELAAFGRPTDLMLLEFVCLLAYALLAMILNQLLPSEQKSVVTFFAGLVLLSGSCGCHLTVWYIFPRRFL